MTKLLIAITAITSFMLGMNGIARAQALPTAVRIQVYGTHQGGNIIYHYNVINNSEVTLNNFVIGNNFDKEFGYEIPQIERLPLGWKWGRESELGTAVVLAPSSTSQPPYWTSKLYGQQEIDYYYLEWGIMPDGQAYAIPPGQSLAGFSVTVPLVDNELSPPEYYNAGQAAGQDDDMYLTGNFKVSYLDIKMNGVQKVWGKLEIADTTPPTLSVTLSPDTLRQNGRYVPITATITVKDDRDPLPAIKLLSITANEPMDEDDIKAKLFTDDRHFQLKAEHDGKSHAGRIYSVTYFATDGSGNQTEATATVTVPHESKRHDDHRDEKDKKDKNDHGRDH